MFQRILWKAEILAQKADKLVTALVMEAARFGDYAKGLAVVADELQILATALYDVIETGRFEEHAEEECTRKLALLAERAELLGINASLESVRARTVYKSALLCAEEIRYIGCSLRALVGEPLSQEAPLIAEPSQSIETISYFLGCDMGDFQFIENTDSIREVLLYSSAKRFNLIKDHVLELRGMRIPFICLFSKLGIAKPEQEEELRLIIVEFGQPREYRAVLVRGFADYGIFPTKPGRHVEMQGLPIDPRFVRECWKTENVGFLPFFNWRAL